MQNTIEILKSNQALINKEYKPVLLRIYNSDDRLIFDKLIAEDKVSFFHDEIYGQLKDFIKCQNPSRRIAEEDFKEIIKEHLNERDVFEYGVWIFYPWSKKLVHLLDETEFIDVRTNRNQYKISKQERDQLLTKKIGIIGLSVGQSIALTIAMERGCGELRLADFDDLELSNLNRIRTGTFNLGINKVVIAAREIAEIDPYLKVTCYFEGLTENNLDQFFLTNGKLDLLIDECDGLDMKILSRYKARALHIPVIMDTSDRGMMDIERFDLEPERPLLHGTAKDLNPVNIKELSNEDKIPVILQMLGAENISTRGKASMVEVQQTINTWPQLASSITLGGGVAADVSRRILLQQNLASGRYYIDLDELIPDRSEKETEKKLHINPFIELTKAEMITSVKDYHFFEKEFEIPDQSIIEKLIEAAIWAPSTGNDQPWKWLYQKGILYLFHDEFRSYSFGDFQKTASYISFGATFENLYLRALNYGLEAKYDFQPIKSFQKLVAAITFYKSESIKQDIISSLSNAIYSRHTNRNIGEKEELSFEALDRLSEVTKSIEGVQIKNFTSEKEIKCLGKIIGRCDRIRLLNPEGHYDFVHREMRWTNQDAEFSKDGIDIQTLGLSNSQLAALGMIKDSEVINVIKQFDGGKAFESLAMRTVSSASALCLITVPRYHLESFFKGGRAMQRFWLEATNLNLAVHPLISPLYLFSRLIHGNGEGLDASSIDELKDLRKDFLELTGLNDQFAEVFLVKISFAKAPELKAHRLPLGKVLFF